MADLHSSDNRMPFFGILKKAIEPGSGPVEIEYLDLTPQTPAEADMVSADFLALLTMEVPLIHYTSVQHFLTLLRSSALYFGRLSEQAKDPNDGTYPNGQTQPPIGLNKKYYDGFPAVRDVEALVAQNATVRQATYIHCWFASPLENAQMWKDFADQSRGVALCALSNELFKAIGKSDPDYRFSIDRARYVSDQMQMPEFMPDAALVRKDPRFAEEQEVRLIARAKHPEALELDALPKYKPFPLDLATGLRAVLVGERASSETYKEIEAEVHSIAPGVKVFRAGILA